MLRSGILVVGLVLAGLAVTGAQAPADAERALRAAIEAEMIRGDVTAAVAEFRRLAQGTDRTVAAEALLRLARRQAIQGDAGARATYERVRRDFADQPTAVAEAVARLTALDEEQSSAQHRLVWDEAIDLWGGVSADGRWLSFVDWETGDLGVRDLTTGQNRRVTNYGGYDAAQGEVEANVISPDGRRVAFVWDHFDNSLAAQGLFELRVIDADGSNQRTVLRSPDHAYLESQAWSPDGSWIALLVDRSLGDAQRPRQSKPGGDVMVVRADGRGERVLASYDDLHPWRLRYSPDGRWISYDLREGSQVPGRGTSRQVAIVAADGSGPPVTLLEGAANMGWSPDGRYVIYSRERMGTSELYAEAFTNGRLSGAPIRLKTSGDIGDPMGMTSDGRLYYGITRRTADAMLSGFDPATGRVADLQFIRPVVGQVGTRGVGAPRFSPDGHQLAMVTGASTIAIRDVASGAERVVLPALPDIRALRWAPDGRALFLTGSDGEPGIFRVDLATQVTTLEARVQSPVLAISPDGGTIYYRGGVVGSPAVVARNRRTGAVTEVAKWTGAVFEIALSPDGSKLAITGANRLAFVDLKTGESVVRWQYSGTGNGRVREGDWTADGTRFVTHYFGPNSEREIWTVPVADREIIRVPMDGRFMGVSVSPNGRRLATMRVANVSQLWVLENFLPADSR